MQKKDWQWNIWYCMQPYWDAVPPTELLKYISRISEVRGHWCHLWHDVCIDDYDQIKYWCNALRFVPKWGKRLQLWQQCVCVCCSHTTDILTIGLKLNKKQRNLYLFSRNLQPQTTTRQMKVASMKIYLTWYTNRQTDLPNCYCLLCHRQQQTMHQCIILCCKMHRKWAETW